MDNFLKVTAKVMRNYRLKNKKKGIPYQIKDIAPIIGISPECLTHYEGGNRKIQLDLWYRWCDALGITHRAAIEKINRELEKENAKNTSK